MGHPADWYADPTGRHEHRYYDGTAWTDHVSDRGVTGRDPVDDGTGRQKPSRLDRFDAMMHVGKQPDPASIQRQVEGAARAGTSPDVTGGGTLFDEPILVVQQKTKIIEINNQYTVYDRQARPLAHVEHVGQSAAKKMARLLASVDQYLTHRLEVRSPDGAILLRLTRPAKVFKSTVIVADGEDRELGRIAQENVFGKISFAYEVDGQRVGGIRGENWRAWNWRIEDASGAEIARITKTFEGVAKTLFTTADNYVVHLHHKPPEPLHHLVVASAIAVDTALKQDARGLG
jgi:uncharacterized protein YxjI